MGGIHTVFSIEDNSYQRWQAELLAWTHERAGQPGPITCLVATAREPTPLAVPRAIAVPPASPHPITGDVYVPYNKPASLMVWLEDERVEEETILLIDPDCVFLDSIEIEAPRGHPIAQPMWYMERAKYRATIGRWCGRPDVLAAVGIPVAIHRDDLRELAPLWLATTSEIRSDPACREESGWIAEMWGYAIAAANMGLAHETRDLARFSTDDQDDLALVHYCYDPEDVDLRWKLAKRDYQPWSVPPEPPASVPRAGAAYARLLREYARLRGEAWVGGVD